MASQKKRRISQSTTKQTNSGSHFPTKTFLHSLFTQHTDLSIFTAYKMKIRFFFPQLRSEVNVRTSLRKMSVTQVREKKTNICPPKLSNATLKVDGLLNRIYPHLQLAIANLDITHSTKMLMYRKVASFLYTAQ